jgi:hypothetical protein
MGWMIKHGTCKHFRGIQHQVCDAGVDMREITGGATVGWVKRMPCHSANGLVECASYSEPTADEIAAEEAEWDMAWANMKKAQPLIRRLRAQYRKTGGQGVEVCPVCAGSLHWSVSSYNGHMHGKCETQGCLNWME